MDEIERHLRDRMAESELDRQIYEADHDTWVRATGPYYRELVETVVAYVEHLPHRYAVRVDHQGRGVVDDPRGHETHQDVDRVLTVHDEATGVELLRLGVWPEQLVLRLGTLYSATHPMCACGTCGMEFRGPAYDETVTAITAFAGGVREQVTEQEGYQPRVRWWQLGRRLRPRAPKMETVWLVEGADWSWEWVLDADDPLVLAATGPVVAPPWPLRSPTD